MSMAHCIIPCPCLWHNLPMSLAHCSIPCPCLWHNLPMPMSMAHCSIPCPCLWPNLPMFMAHLPILGYLYTLQPHYNTVVYSMNSVEAWLPLPILPMYNSLIITLFCYNTDYTMEPKNSVIMRFQCSKVWLNALQFLSTQRKKLLLKESEDDWETKIIIIIIRLGFSKNCHKSR